MAREGKSQSVLVLWLKEEALKDQPLQKLSSLIEFIHGEHSRKEHDIHTKIIGPHSSDTLKDMVREARDPDVSKWAEQRWLGLSEQFSRFDKWTTFSPQERG